MINIVKIKIMIEMILMIFFIFMVSPLYISYFLHILCYNQEKGGRMMAFEKNRYKYSRYEYFSGHWQRLDAYNGW